MCIVIKEHMSAVCVCVCVCVCVGRGRRPAGRLIKYAGSLEAEWNVAHLPARTSSLGAWRVMRGASVCVCVCVCVEADLHSEWLHCSEMGYVFHLLLQTNVIKARSDSISVGVKILTVSVQYL